MLFAEFLDKDIVVTQTRSKSKLTKKQLANLKGLGLKKIGSCSEFKASNEILGMARKVNNIINISLK